MENKRKNQFPKSTIKNMLFTLRRIGSIKIRKPINQKSIKAKFNPTILEWNNNLKQTTINIESEYLKTKGLTYAQISPIK